MDKIKAAAVQMVSSCDAAENIAVMKRLVREAAQQGADWVVLPEYWPLMGQTDRDKLAFAETFGQGRLQDAMAEAAAENGVVLFGGSVPLAGGFPDKVLNTLLVYGRDGACTARYDKIHLFGYSGLGERYAEADTIEAGRDVPHFSADGWGVAQGICYDLRFPELFRAQQPFDVLILPAAFTYTTGKAHWELLLRARAVENQCYLIASGQGGLHQNARRTFGHSMIIDPWGDVLAVLPEGEGVALSDLDKTRLNSVRSRLPALQHRII
ncbi:MAG: carbon-nitrogen hydrolase family protein [Neisseria sp.]|nr:carbon-nitrogen hydrolase family protein [Neisseria sp.]